MMPAQANSAEAASIGMHSGLPEQAFEIVATDIAHLIVLFKRCDRIGRRSVRPGGAGRGQ